MKALDVLGCAAGLIWIVEATTMLLNNDVPMPEFHQFSLLLSALIISALLVVKGIHLVGEDNEPAP